MDWKSFRAWAQAHPGWSFGGLVAVFVSLMDTLIPNWVGPGPEFVWYFAMNLVASVMLAWVAWFALHLGE